LLAIASHALNLVSVVDGGERLERHKEGKSSPNQRKKTYKAFVVRDDCRFMLTLYS
jgi:hypothetical protein